MAARVGACGSWPALTTWGVVAALAGVAVGLVPPRAAGQAPPCLSGFVPREASPVDDVCVPPDSKARAQAENAVAPLLWTPGPYGVKTCALGYVWREAFPGDFTCVTPAIRALVRQENDLAPTRRSP